MALDRNDFFREVTVRICSSLDILKGLQRTLEYLKQMIPIDSISMHIYEESLRAVRTIAVTDHVGGGTTDIVMSPSKDAMSKYLKQDFPKLLEFSRAELEPVRIRIVNRPETDPFIGSMTPFFRSHDFSAILMRLYIQAEYLGIVAFRAEGRDKFTSEQAELVSLLHEPFAIALSNHLSHLEVLKLRDMLIDDNHHLRRELLHLRGDQIVGAEFGLKHVMDMVSQVAPIDSPVLLQGETGVGKDVFANTIHYSSPRREGPFVKVNCGAIPETLIDSELFGHEKGAFTGALMQRRGYFERANGGTIFLDEIGELSPHAQVRLLRVLQYKEFERVGGSGPIHVDTRIIAATHRNMEEMVKNGQFRHDLWFRFNVFPIKIPPLRERKEDIPALVYHIMSRKSKELRLPAATLAKGVIDRLKAYCWPGNVRELEHAVERALVLSRGRPIDFGLLLPPQKVDGNVPTAEDEVFDFEEVCARHIRRVLQATGGKVHGPGGAAERLNMNPSTLRNKMNSLGITYGRRAQHTADG